VRTDDAGQRRGPKATTDTPGRSGRKRKKSTAGITWELTDAQRAVRKLREALHLSQDGLARAMGKAMITISTWETKRPPGWQSLYELARFAEEHGQTACAAEFQQAFEAEFVVESGYTIDQMISGVATAVAREKAKCVIPYETHEEMTAMLVARHRVRARVSLKQAQKEVAAALTINNELSGVLISDCLKYLDGMALWQPTGKGEKGRG